MSHCDDSLRKIYNVLQTYQQNHDGKNPACLLDLIEDSELNVWDFVCPNCDVPVGQSSYIYRGEDLDQSAKKEMILAYDKNPVHKGRRNILFVNGEVLRPPESVFESAIRKDNACRESLGLSQKPI